MAFYFSVDVVVYTGFYYIDIFIMIKYPVNREKRGAEIEKTVCITALCTTVLYSRGYKGESSYKTDYSTEADFVEYYKDFDSDIAYTKSPDGLRYIAKLGKDIYVAAIYTPQSFMSGATTAEEEMLSWLDAELAKLDENAKIIALAHQNITKHYPDDSFSFKYTIANNEELIGICSRHGVDLNLSGHIHLRHIAQIDSGITDIATSSLTIRECQYGVVQIIHEKISCNAKAVDMQSWAAAKGISNEIFTEFDNYNNEFYFESAYAKAISSLEGENLTDEEKDALATLWAEFNVHYFAGTVNEFYPQMTENEGYKIWQDKGLDSNRNFAYITTALSGIALYKTQISWEKSF